MRIRTYALATVGLTVLLGLTLGGCAGTVSGTQFQVSPASLNLGTEQTTGTLDIVYYDAAGADQTWIVTGAPSWATVTPLAGTGNAVLTVQATRAGLTEGIYSESIQIQGAVDLVTISVTMEIQAP